MSGKRAVTLLLIIVLGISALWYLYATTLAPVGGSRKNILGVIDITGPILQTSDADRYTGIINTAITNESIKAVVLKIDCPGGYANLIEQIYFDMLQLKSKKPICAVAISALSGGYYIAVASDYIYVLPTSSIGNVGIIGVGPSTLIPSESTIESGPQKLTGYSKLTFSFSLSHALDSFVSAVVNGRKDHLKITLNEVKTGSIYMGSEAIMAGLADEVGSLQSAIQREAREAKITEYEIQDVNTIYETSMAANTSLQRTIQWRNLTLQTLDEMNPPPALYYLYLPSTMLAQGLQSNQTSAIVSSNVTKSGKGLVLIDETHGNLASESDFNKLMGELTMRNVTSGLVYTWKELDEDLENASCLIVASPTTAYSKEEVDRVEKFVNAGGLVLLFYDPAAEHVQASALFEPINSLAARFGIFFAEGYLYNQQQNYGNYRNIYVNDFANHNLTQGLSRLVFFTATHIYTSGKNLAWTSNTTYSSTLEKAGNYTTIAVSGANANVIAFGDMSFLEEPYCGVEDNGQLMQNLATLIAGNTSPRT